MRSAARASARRQLDKRLVALGNVDLLIRPARGWVKAMREALGMTTAQLAKRMGVSQPRVVALEQAEAKGVLTMDSLQRAAHALDCRLFYALVPRLSLEKTVNERALHLAKKRLKGTSHSMALEAQAVDKADEREQLKRLASEIAEQAGSELWEDDA